MFWTSQPRRNYVTVVGHGPITKWPRETTAINLSRNIAGDRNENVSSNVNIWRLVTEISSPYKRLELRPCYDTIIRVSYLVDGWNRVVCVHS